MESCTLDLFDFISFKKEDLRKLTRKILFYMNEVHVFFISAASLRLMNADIEVGNFERATEWMNEQDRGLAKHSTECGEGINWEGSRIMGRENGRTQRKMLEGVETIKQKGKGKKVLNTCNQMEQWTIYSFLNK